MKEANVCLWPNKRYVRHVGHPVPSDGGRAAAPPRMELLRGSGFTRGGGGDCWRRHPCSEGGHPVGDHCDPLSTVPSSSFGFLIVYADCRVIETYPNQIKTDVRGINDTRALHPTERARGKTPQSSKKDAINLALFIELDSTRLEDMCTVNYKQSLVHS